MFGLKIIEVKEHRAMFEELHDTKRALDSRKKETVRQMLKIQSLEDEITRLRDRVDGAEHLLSVTKCTVKALQDKYVNRARDAKGRYIKK